MLQQRDRHIDQIKGIGIILMVLGHSGFPYTHFLYLFHMAIFFMVSGYLFKTKDVVNIKNFVKFIFRKIKALWLPFFIWQSSFSLLNNLFIKVNIYTDQPVFQELTPSIYKTLHEFMSPTQTYKEVIKSFFFLGGTQMGGAFWFLQTMFVVVCLYYTIEFILNKIFKHKKKVFNIQMFLGIIFLIIGWKEMLPINIINRSFSCYFLFGLGRIIHSLNIERKIDMIWKCIICLVLSLGILIILNYYGGVSLNINTYVNPIFLIATSLCGWCFLLSVIILVEHIKMNNVLLFFEIIGKHTLAIVTLHFISFKIVNLVQVIIYSKPNFLIASYPVLYSKNGWWLVYCFIGIELPVLLDWIWWLSKNRMKTWYMILINK